MKKIFSALLCAAALCAVLVGCTGNLTEENKQPSGGAPSSSAPETDQTGETGTLPAAPSLALRKDAQFLPLEQAQRQERFSGWLPAGNPLPGMHNKIAFNEQVEYVIVLFRSQDREEAIYMTLLGTVQTPVSSVEPEKSCWNDAVVRHEVGLSLSLAVGAKDVFLYTTSGDSANLMAAADWIAAL